jgi:hypothetical protein
MLTLPTSPKTGGRRHAQSFDVDSCVWVGGKYAVRLRASAMGQTRRYGSARRKRLERMRPIKRQLAILVPGLRAASTKAFSR